MRMYYTIQWRQQGKCAFAQNEHSKLRIRCEGELDIDALKAILTLRRADALKIVQVNEVDSVLKMRRA